MNTNDLIKTAQYLDKLGSFKIADKVENKLVRLAQAGKLIVDPAIRNEYNAIKKLLEKFKKQEEKYFEKKSRKYIIMLIGIAIFGYTGWFLMTFLRSFTNSLYDRTGLEKVTTE